MAFGDNLRTDTRKTTHLKVALFVDGANMFAAAKNLGWDIDWDKVLEFYQSRYDLIRAYYYTAIPEGNAPLRPLVDHLDYNGWAMKTKPTKQWTDEQGRLKMKGNMDMEMALDAIDMCAHVSDIFLFTGDGDFRILTERVQQRGVRVHGVSTIECKPPMIADEFRRQVDFFHELHEMQKFFKRG